MAAVEISATTSRTTFASTAASYPDPQSLPLPHLAEEFADLPPDLIPPPLALARTKEETKPQWDLHTPPSEN